MEISIFWKNMKERRRSWKWGLWEVNIWWTMFINIIKIKVWLRQNSVGGGWGDSWHYLTLETRYDNNLLQWKLFPCRRLAWLAPRGSDTEYHGFSRTSPSEQNTEWVAKRPWVLERVNTASCRVASCELIWIFSHNDGQTDVVSHLDLEEDVCDLLHLDKVVIQLCMFRPGHFLTDQLVRLEYQCERFPVIFSWQTLEICFLIPPMEGMWMLLKVAPKNDIFSSEKRMR